MQHCHMLFHMMLLVMSQSMWCCHPLWSHSATLHVRVLWHNPWHHCDVMEPYDVTSFLLHKNCDKQLSQTSFCNFLKQTSQQTQAFCLWQWRLGRIWANCSSDRLQGWWVYCWMVSTGWGVVERIWETDPTQLTVLLSLFMTLNGTLAFYIELAVTMVMCHLLMTSQIS